jgi:hypothetical protein
MTDGKETQELIRKHGTLTPKEIRKRFKEMKKMKETMTTDAAVLEQNMMEFNKTTDPLVDPESGKPLCWIRRPTTDELEALIPAELLEYRNKPDEVPESVMKKYKDFQFQMMAQLIDIPKKPASWWKKNANLVFQQLFQMHLTGILKDLGISAENF